MRGTSDLAGIVTAATRTSSIVLDRFPVSQIFAEAPRGSLSDVTGLPDRTVGVGAHDAAWADPLSVTPASVATNVAAVTTASPGRAKSPRRILPIELLSSLIFRQRRSP